MATREQVRFVGRRTLCYSLLLVRLLTSVVFALHFPSQLQFIGYVLLNSRVKLSTTARVLWRALARANPLLAD